MFNPVYRGKGQASLVLSLLGLQAIGIYVYGQMLQSANAEYALLGFLLPFGGGFLYTSILLFFLVGQLSNKSWVEPQKDRAYLDACWNGYAFLVQLTVVLVTLASMVDTPAAGTTVRLWGWIPLAIFCGFTSFNAAVIFGKRGLLLENSSKTHWGVRWAFTLSFLFLPVNFHFFAFSEITVAAVVLIQILLAGALLFDWQQASRYAEGGATSTTA